MARRERIKHQAERYITILQPKLEMKTGGMINLESLQKPESSPPCSDTALDLIKHPDNVNAAQMLEPIIQDLRRTHFPRYFVICKAGYRHGEPGALKNWRAAQTEDDRAQLSIFESALEWMVDEVQKRYPGRKLRVVTDPDDEPADTLRQACERERRWGTEHSYRLLASEVERVMDEEGCGIDAAKGLVSQRYNKRLGTPCSFGRIHRAWLFARGESKDKAV